MRAKFINENLNSNYPSAFVEMYSNWSKDLHEMPDFGSFTLGDAFGPESEFRGDDMLEPKEIALFDTLPENWGTWVKWAEEEEFGIGEQDEEDYYDFENKLLSSLNFKSITPTLYYDSNAKTGYYINEYQQSVTPEYYTWFFAI